MKIAIIAMAVALAVCASCFAFSFDMPDLERRQPDGTVFHGREWGDEFAVQYETTDGYRYVYNPATRYFHYAILNAEGNYTASPHKVGIDNPSTHGIPRHLVICPPSLDRYLCE